MLTTCHIFFLAFFIPAENKSQDLHDEQKPKVESLKCNHGVLMVRDPANSRHSALWYSSS